MQALSVRQPYAWLIVNGFKNIENRSKFTYKRQGILIHAGLKFADLGTLERGRIEQLIGRALPSVSDLERGGIVGEAKIIGCVDRSDNPWYSGEYSNGKRNYGWLLAAARPLPFFSCTGQLGFFDVDYPPEMAFYAGQQWAAERVKT